MRPKELRELVDVILPAGNYDTAHMERGIERDDRTYVSMPPAPDGVGEDLIVYDRHVYSEPTARAIWALVGHAHLLVELYELMDSVENSECHDIRGMSSIIASLRELKDQPCMHGGSCKGRIIGNRDDV